MTTSQAFKAHVEHLVEMAEDGCDMSAKSLAAFALLADGWRYGDPDPGDPPGGGGEVVDFQQCVSEMRQEFGDQFAMTNLSNELLNIRFGRK